MHVVILVMYIIISAALDQHCRNVSPPLFKESQHMVVRMRVAMMVGEAVFSGEWEAAMFTDYDNNVNKYMSEMSSSGVFVDQYFLIKLAQLLETDIIIIFIHPDVLSVDPESFSPCVIVPGGPGSTYATNIPIFLGYFEERYYRVCILVS